MDKTKILLALLAVLIVGFVLGGNLNRPVTKTIVTGGVDDQKSLTVSDGDRPLYYIISLETPKGVLELKVLTNAIRFEPYEPSQGGDKGYFKSGLVLDKNKYPKLFQQGAANASFISARVLTQSNGKFVVEVSNNEPDHGSFSPSYRLSVDPISGEIVENNHPRRDESLSKADSEYLSQYPNISELIGNSTLWKLDKKPLIVGNMTFESVITIPVTSANGQGLYIFDKNKTIFVEKGYEMSVKSVGDTVEVRFKSDMLGIGKDTMVVKVYAVDNVAKTLTKLKEYEEPIK